jgi:hypothetical protein
MKQPFVRLLEEVDKIDLSAGRYLRTKARELSSFEEFGRVTGCFLWRDSPQGKDYWSNINYKVMEMRKNAETL